MSDYARVVDFIHEMYGSSEFVPLSVPKFIGNEKKYLNECIDTTICLKRWQIRRPFRRREIGPFDYMGLRKAVGLCQWNERSPYVFASCRVERDDEVLTQALTFVATCNALSYIGAHPDFY